jgi:hypothetical protein
VNRFTRIRRLDATKQRSRTVRLLVEVLEARNLLNGTPTNVLVNNPAEDTISMQDTQSETAIVLGANSNVIVSYNDTGAGTFPTPLNPTLAGYSLSTNTGSSFTDEGQLPHTLPYWAGYDPVLARSSKTGTVFESVNSIDSDLMAGSGERVLIYRSVDNGQTFSAPINGTPGFVPGVDIADKPWIAVDNYPGPGYGNAYLAWTDFNTNLFAQDIFFTRSTNDGQDWGPSGGITIQAPKLFGGNSHNFSGANVTVGPDHAVYVFWWDNTQNASILMRKSTDQGQTFSDPVTVAGLKTHGYHGDLGLTDSSGRTFTTNAFPQAAVNPVTGDIYVVYDDQGHGSQDKADIYFTESCDGGQTWSKSVRVNDDATYNDQRQPAIAVTPDGSHVGIFWYDRRLDPADNLIDRFGAIGTVSGHSLTFAPNFRITDVSFQPAFGQDPRVSPNYMGDYDMATADNNYFYTTWGDNRLSDAFFANQPDVRFAKIPVGGETDPSLVVGGTPALAETSPSAYSSDGSGSDPARLLVGVINSMAATTPVNHSAFPLGRSTNQNNHEVPVMPTDVPNDTRAAQVRASSNSRLTPAADTNALDLVLVEAGDAGLADGLALGMISL